MSSGGFKKLEVWRRAKDLAVRIYKISVDGDLSRDYGLRDQLRRAAVSIASNLAEGDERDSDRDSIRFFHFAKGSVAELRTQLEIAFEVGYVDKSTFEKLDDECCQIGRMIGALINARKKASPPLPASPLPNRGLLNGDRKSEIRCQNEREFFATCSLYPAPCPFYLDISNSKSLI